MNLYHYLSLESFVKGWKKTAAGEEAFHLRLGNLLLLQPDSDIRYSLSLIACAIDRYEEVHAIPASKSKRRIPLFRNRRRMLVGPEVEHYMVSLYESFRTTEAFAGGKKSPSVTLAFDYEELASHCIFENLFLVRCKYDEDENVERLTKLLEREYDKFFFDEEHSGFTADSRFSELLGKALLESCPPSDAPKGEWRMATLCSPADASYTFEDNELRPYVELAVPRECLAGVMLNRADEMPLQYTALAGFLESKGIRPEKFLAGMEDAAL